VVTFKNPIELNITVDGNQKTLKGDVLYSNLKSNFIFFKETPAIEKQTILDNKKDIVRLNQKYNDDFDVVLDACKKDSSQIQYASERLAIKLVAMDNTRFRYLSDTQKNSLEFIEGIIKMNNNNGVLKHIDNVEIASKFINMNSYHFFNLSETLSKNKFIIGTALSKDPSILKRLDKNQQKQVIDLIQQIIKTNPALGTHVKVTSFQKALDRIKKVTKSNFF
jgi:hypothetical protein